MAIHWNCLDYCNKNEHFDDEGRRTAQSRLAESALKNAKDLMVLFGITPVAREKLRIQPKKDMTDPMANFV